MFLVQTAIETGEEIEKAVPETIAAMEKGYCRLDRIW